MNERDRLAGKILGVVHVGAWIAELGLKFAREIMPQVTVLNITDDTIQWAAERAMAEQGVALENIPPSGYYRAATYFQFLEQVGAHAALFGCSTNNRAVAYARPLVKIPLIPIDRPMMDKAVQLGKRIGLVATLATTIPASTLQLKDAAAAAGKEIDIVPMLETKAFEALRAGDKATHDAILMDTIRAHEDDVDVIAMAQLSMSQLEDQIEAAGFAIPVLNSGREGFLRARDVLASLP
jgi:Asp/Glu/hydantoin racemase